MYLDPAPARQHDSQPKVSSCCGGHFLTANSSGSES
jgi:hypothetical protein